MVRHCSGRGRGWVAGAKRCVGRTVSAGLLVVVSACAGSAPSRPVSTAPVSDAELKRLVEHRVLTQGRATGAVVLVAGPSGRRLVVARSPQRADGPELGADTVFEIASLSKIFTSLLLADAVVRGEAALDDPLSAYVPDGSAVPDYAGQPITLLDLATHGSGLPLRPSNLAAAFPDTPDKYAGYRLDQLYAALPTYRIERAPGTQFEYSNLGFGLLGQGLARKSGTTYEALLAERITRPLGLHDTGIDDDPAKAARRAQGHDADLRPVGPTHYGALDPAGGLRSTAADLMTLIELFVDGRGPDHLVRAAELMLTVDRPANGDTVRMALGWRRETVHGETYYWSNGSGDGSRTFMGFNPRRGVAVIALADAASGGGLDDIGRFVLDRQQQVDLKVVPRPKIVELPDSVVGQVLGVYEYEPGDRMSIGRGATGLIVTTGPNQLVISPSSPTRYFANASPDLVFDFGDITADGAQTMTLHQDGVAYLYRRVE